MTLEQLITLLENNNTSQVVEWLKRASSKDLLVLSDSIFNEYQSRRDVENEQRNN